MEKKEELEPVFDTSQGQAFTVKESGVYRVFNNMLYLEKDKTYTLADLLEAPPVVKLNRAERRALEKRQRSKR